MSCHLDRQELEGIKCQMDRIRRELSDLSALDVWAVTEARKQIFPALDLIDWILDGAAERKSGGICDDRS